MNRYQVLWIDDDAEKQDGFLDSAYLEGLDINYYKTSKEGMEELTSKIEQYDAVILDAMVYNESEDETAALTGLFSSIKKINSLSDRKKIPYFIFSGHIAKDENSSAREMLANETIFIKSKDNQALFQAIKKEAVTQIDLQIKHENPLLFDVLKEYSDSARNVFISIFKCIKGYNNKFDDQLYFTQLRIILELMFRKANAIGLLHDKCVQVNGSQVNLTESCSFLSGSDTKHLKVKCAVTHFPKVIATNIQNLIYITGAASHTTEVDITKNIDIQTYRQDINTPYLLYSLTLQLMDVLIWFNVYRMANSDIALNQSHWLNIEVDQFRNKYETELLTNIASNGWGTVLVNNGTKRVGIHRDEITKLNLTIGDSIKFIVKDSAKAQDITKL
jgi:hypothetical protein